MCVYFLCGMGDATVMCQGTAMPAMLGPTTGCCDTTSIDVALNCSGSPDESADVFVVLSDAPADACVDYSVVYDYAP